jgi:hypothetical protein
MENKQKAMRNRQRVTEDARQLYGEPALQFLILHSSLSIDFNDGEGR